jgi:hypothetical protein
MFLYMFILPIILFGCLLTFVLNLVIILAFPLIRNLSKVTRLHILSWVPPKSNASHPSLAQRERCACLKLLQSYQVTLNLKIKLQINIYEIVVNFFHWSHRLICYCLAIVYAFTRFVQLWTYLQNNLCKFVLKFSKSKDQSVFILWLNWGKIHRSQKK